METILATRLNKNTIKNQKIYFNNGLIEHCNSKMTQTKIVNIQESIFFTQVKVLPINKKTYLCHQELILINSKNLLFY